MNRMVTAAVTAAGSLALLSGVLVAGAAPAGATPVPNGAFGAAATGPVTLAPVAGAQPGHTPAVASNANLPGLLATGTIVDRADDLGAWSRINQPIVLTLPNHGSLSASGIRSWCLYNNGSPFGGTDIFSGAIVQVGQLTVPLPARPAPNTVINLPDAAGTITLNQQIPVGPGLAVYAIYAVIGGQTVTLGASGCDVGE